MDREMLLALVRILVLLPLVCILAYLTVRFGLGRVKSWPVPGGRKRMRVLEQVSLGPKAGLSLVQVGEKYMLFAHQEGSILLVKEMDELPGEITAERLERPALAGLYKVLRPSGRERKNK